MKKSTLENILTIGLDSGFDFCEVFLEKKRMTRLVQKTHETQQANQEFLHGIGLRFLKGTEEYYLSGAYGDEERLLKELKTSLETRENKLSLKDSSDVRLAIQKDFASIDLREKQQLLRFMTEEGLAYDPRLVGMDSLYLDMSQEVIIANSTGLYVTDERNKTRLFSQSIAQEGDVIERGWVGPGHLGGFEFYDDLDLKAYAREAARMAIVNLSATYAEGGVMPVVVDRGFGGLLFHEACGHSLEATSVSRGSSEFCNRLGEEVASPLLTLVDDGSIPGRWGSLQVDDEGMKTQRNVLIEKGILKGYLIDILGGRRMGMEPTGSARRENYTFAPTSRMTNTFIEAGQDDDDQMIKDLEKGLFVKGINAGSVNPATGEFNFNVGEAYLIEQGELTKPVKGLSLIGTGGDILKQVDAVGKDTSIGDGFCWSASGALYIGAGQPRIRLKRMMVGGR